MIFIQLQPSAVETEEQNPLCIDDLIDTDAAFWLHPLQTELFQVPRL